MTDKRCILLTTDMSAESMRAFAPVADMALRLGARVTLLRVVHDQVHPVAPPAKAPMTTSVPLAMEPTAAAAAARERLLELRGRFPDDLEIDVDTVLGNDVASAILDYARRHGVDLITMATHGRSGLRRLVIGSIAEAVLRHSTVPVLLYPPASSA
jgi:nucleotide-binding universal stress UspA family protein